jgi:hypothetical protein
MCRALQRSTTGALRPAVDEWVETKLPEDAMTFGDAVAVEHRYIGDIVAAVLADGMRVETPNYEDAGPDVRP